MSAIHLLKRAACTPVRPPPPSAGQLLVGVADARRWHFSVTLITYVITMASAERV